MRDFVLISDIHNEVSYFNFDYLKNKNNRERVLLVAGDYFTNTHWPAGYTGFLFGELASYYHAIVIILGNHDYYDYTLKEAILQAKLSVEEYENIHVLCYEDVLQIDDVYIFGDTMWADIPPYAIPAIQCIDGYSYINSSYVEGGILRVDETNEWNAKAKEKMVEFLIKYKDQKKIVMTHFPPIYIERGFEDKMMNLFYQNSGIEKHFYEDYAPDIHAFGHIHDEFVEQIGNTICMCNPVGYEVEEVFELKTFSL